MGSIRLKCPCHLDPIDPYLHILKQGMHLFYIFALIQNLFFVQKINPYHNILYKNVNFNSFVNDKDSKK